MRKADARGNDSWEYYPERAYREELNGRVVFACQIKADGSFTECEIHSETPANCDFGSATFALIGKGGIVPPADVVRDHAGSSDMVELQVDWKQFPHARADKHC
jgi:hypothetical protein